MSFENDVFLQITDKQPYYIYTCMYRFPFLASEIYFDTFYRNLAPSVFFIFQFSGSFSLYQCIVVINMNVLKSPNNIQIVQSALINCFSFTYNYI